MWRVRPFSWWRERRCFHGEPGGTSFVVCMGIADPGRKIWECREVMGGCGKRWIF